MNFKITLSGSGSKRELAIALQNLASEIKESSNEDLDGKNYEDPYIQAEIEEGDEDEE